MILTLITGFLQTGIQMIVFRALQGVSLALCLPSAVSILSGSLPQGRWRNMGFGALGAGQPVGFAAGLVVSGALLDNIGWRWAFWIVAVTSTFVTVAAFLALPKDMSRGRIHWNQLGKVDWTGAILSATSLGLLSYVMAYVIFLDNPDMIMALLIEITELLVSPGLNGHSCPSSFQHAYRLFLVLDSFTGLIVKRNSANLA